MRGEEGVVQSGTIVWVELAARGGRRTGRFVISGWRRAAVKGGRGEKLVGAEHGAGGGTVGNC